MQGPYLCVERPLHGYGKHQIGPDPTASIDLGLDALHRVQKAIDAEIPVELKDDPLMDAEYAELNARREAHRRGEGNTFTREEALRLAKEGYGR